MSMVFVTADGDSVGQKVGRLRLANDVDGLRRVNQGIDRGNEVFGAWALSHGGSVVEAGGDEITVMVDAQYLDELPDQRRLYAEYVGSTVSVGVGFKISESTKALLAAKLRHGNAVVFYVPTIDTELAAAEKDRPDEARKLVEECLAPVSKAEAQYCSACRDPLDSAGHCKVKAHWPLLEKDEQPGYHRPGAAAAPVRGQAEHSEAQVAREEAAKAPPVEHTHASGDFEEVLKELRAHAEKGDASAAKTGGEAKAREQAAKEEAARALVKMKKVMPVLDRLRNASPEAYDAVNGLARAMVELGRAAGYGPKSSPAEGEEERGGSRVSDILGKGEFDVRSIGQEAPAVGVPFGKNEELAKSDRTTPHGFVDPEGHFHDIGDEDHHYWIARKMGVADPGDDDVDDAPYYEAMKRGWMGVGVAGGHNVQAFGGHIQNSNHPATKAVRAIAKKHWGPVFDLYMHDASGPMGFEGDDTKRDTRAFVGRGALVPPSPFRKSEFDEDARGAGPQPRLTTIPKDVRADILAAGPDPEKIGEAVRRHEPRLASMWGMRGREFLDCDEANTLVCDALVHHGVPHQDVLGNSDEGSSHAWVRVDGKDHDATQQGFGNPADHHVIGEFDSSGHRWETNGDEGPWRGVSKSETDARYEAMVKDEPPGFVDSFGHVAAHVRRHDPKAGAASKFGLAQVRPAEYYWSAVPMALDVEHPDIDVRDPANPAAVEEYASRIRAGSEPPAIFAAWNPKGRFLSVLDGEHRRAAVAAAGGKRVAAYVGLPKSMAGSGHWIEKLRPYERAVPEPVEHRLPGMAAAEGYRALVYHAPSSISARIHRGSKPVGMVERDADGGEREAWAGGRPERAGLREATRMLIDGHVGGSALRDAWSEPERVPGGLAKAEELRKDEGPVPPAEPGEVHGAKVTAPSPTYEHGVARAATGKGGKNVWVRQGAPGADNKDRTLMVQFASDLLQGGRPKDQADAYYDKLYRSREGYHRPADFWEVPQWQGHLAASMPNADAYVARDPEELGRFAHEAGYGHVAFSALDVNSGHVRDFAKKYPGKVAVGGYTDMGAFRGMPNVEVHPSVKGFVESRGLPYRGGYDYRHYEGTKTIPRLTMSEGCKHNCDYCTVPKTVDEKSRDEIMQQADSFAKTPSDLVYVNDKTFGQAANHTLLPEVYERIKARNPAFKGFVIQTTASQLAKMDPEFLKRAGVRHVELGIESFNDPVLRGVRKPATEATIEAAARKLRAAGISLIPNIMVGLPGEDERTYGRTMDWLRRNRDIVSHTNAYNLAVYNETPLANKLKVLSDADRDENARTKSWMADPAVHDRFHDELFRYSNEQLDRRPFEQETFKSELDARFEPLEKAERFRHPTLERLAQEYAAGAGLPYETPSLEPANEDLMRRASAAYLAAKHDPDHPDVKAAYDALKRETLAQYQFLKSRGYTFGANPGNANPVKFPATAFDPNGDTRFSYVGDAGDPMPEGKVPYGGRFENLYHDIWGNRHLNVFTGAAPSDHPMAERLPDPNDPLQTYNNAFRAVHDVFGHANSVQRIKGDSRFAGYDLGHHGEEHASRAQAPMYSPLARRALATETRGQNTAYHFGPNGQSNRANPARAIYPDQKAALLPEEFSTWPKGDGSGLRKDDGAPAEALEAEEDPAAPRRHDARLEKGPLPMPKPAISKRVVFPPGTRIDDREKVIHSDGGTSWRQMRSGMILSQDPSGHPTSSRTPNAKSELDARFEPLEKMSRPEGVRVYNRMLDKWRRNGEGRHFGPESEEAARRARITINFPSHIAPQLAQSGRFLNQYETGTSRGFLDPDYDGSRAATENSLFGIESDEKFKVRPVYGAVTHEPHHFHFGAAPSYGDAFAILKPHVHERSTFTPGDSLDHGSGGRVFVHRHLPVVFAYGKEGSYYEAQVHGGVELGRDVESLHLEPTVSDANAPWLLELGKKFGVPVYRHRMNVPPPPGYWSWPSRSARDALKTNPDLATKELLYDPRLSPPPEGARELPGSQLPLPLSAAPARSRTSKEPPAQSSGPLPQSRRPQTGSPLVRWRRGRLTGRSPEAKP